MRQECQSLTLTPALSGLTEVDLIPPLIPMDEIVPPYLALGGRETGAVVNVAAEVMARVTALHPFESSALGEFQ